MSNLILPEDPDFHQPLKMGDPYQQALTPKLASEKRIKEATANGSRYFTGAAHFPEYAKTAQMTSANTNMITSPMFFSPIHTVQSWQTPAKRREMYMWARFFYQTEPKVAAAIDFYSRFSMNNFKLECKDNKIEQWFWHHVVKKLDINEMLKAIASEYFTLGDVFIHMNVDCPKCQGKNRDPDNPEEECDHEGGTFSKMIVLKPDDIEVRYAPFANEPVITMIPDQEWRTIVEKRQPKELYDQIPEELRATILSRHPIMLSNRTTTHLKHMPSPYETYGTSLIRRLFTTLAYKTKLMSANWIVAERMILPVRVVKIGDKDNPPSAIDIIDVQQQLAATANDPNLTIITHHNFDYEFYGACHDINTEILTAAGWKKFPDVALGESVATYNVKTEQIEYQPTQEIHEYYFKSSKSKKMVHIQHRSVDVMVTPNHTMLIERNGTIQTVRADEIKHNDKFISSCSWNGIFTDEYLRTSPLSHMSMNDFIELAGYYISEGGVKIERYKNLAPDKQIQACGISQNIVSPHHDKIKECVRKAYPRFSERTTGDAKYTIVHTFMINSVEIARYMAKVFGVNSFEKQIPQWVKDLPTKYLSVLLEALVAGDGTTRKSKKGAERYIYTTVSKQLADDLSEILLKLGFFSTISDSEKIDSGTLYKVYWSNRRKDTKFTIRNRNIHREDYNDQVYCVTVPNSFIVTRRNNRITIQGNSGKILQTTQEMEFISKEILDGFMLNQALLNGEMSGYQSAQVGVETLIRRIESFRETLADFVENRIFKPIAEMQGFIDQKKSDELGVPVYIYPKLVFNDLNLKDKTQERNLFIQLHDKGILSTRTLCEKMDVNYDQEVHRKRFEQVAGGPQGGGLGMGAGGGPGGAGGAPGGGMPGGDMGAGGAPGAGPPGMGGAPGGGMAGTMPSGDVGAPGAGGGPAASGNMKILKKGKHANKQEAEPQQVQPIQMTSLEQEMAVIMEEVGQKLGWNPQQIFENIRIQYPVKNPEGHRPYMLDFALPRYKISAECDGGFWHGQPEQMQEDKDRDYKLAKYGWTVLRFDENTVKDNRDGVLSTVMQYIQKAMSQNQNKTASIVSDFEPSGKEGPAHIFVANGKGELVDIQGQYELYASIFEGRRK